MYFSQVDNSKVKEIHLSRTIFQYYILILSPGRYENTELEPLFGSTRKPATLVIILRMCVKRKQSFEGSSSITIYGPSLPPFKYVVLLISNNSYK